MRMERLAWSRVLRAKHVGRRRRRTLKSVLPYEKTWMREVVRIEEVEEETDGGMQAKLLLPWSRERERKRQMGATCRPSWKERKREEERKRRHSKT